MTYRPGRRGRFRRTTDVFGFVPRRLDGGPKFHKNPDDLIALLFEDCRRHRTIHSARHRTNYPFFLHSRVILAQNIS